MPGNQHPKISIVIVNWNSGQLLRDCVSTIAAAKRDGFGISSVTIVDNASSDRSQDGTQRDGVRVRVIRNSVNRGFAAACNQGAAGCQDDYLLFLNPDTRLFGDSLTKPINFMQQPSSAAIGICGIRLLDSAGNPTTAAARFPTLRVMVGRTLGLTKIFPHIFPLHLLSGNDLRESGLVDQVIGAFFLIRKSVFDLCGGFDERFFVYFEEVDLSLRAKKLGYSSYFLSDVSAFHKGGGCTDQVKAARLFYSLRSRIIYAKKHDSSAEWLCLILLTGMEFPLRLIQGITKASWTDIKNTFIAYTHLLSYFIRGNE